MANSDKILVALLRQILDEQENTNRKLGIIMAKIDELNQMVADLQVSLDKEQEQIKAALEALQAEIKRLEDIIASGSGAATDEQLQAVIDNLKVIQTDLEATIPDAPPEPGPTSKK
jgi:uncharacterized coiled-coil protein SlyX